MNKQQGRKNQRKAIEKLFNDNFKSLVDEGGQAKPPTAKSTPIVDKIMYKKLKRTK